MKIEYKTNSTGIMGDRYRFGFIKIQGEYSRPGCVREYVPFISWRNNSTEDRVVVKGAPEPVRRKAVKALEYIVSSHELDPVFWEDFTWQIHKRFGQSKDPATLYPRKPR